MQIFISILINIIILAVILPLFYIYITYKARERLEKEIIKKAREEIEALVKEFNHVAISNISILEDSILRAKKITDQIKTINNENTNKTNDTFFKELDNNVDDYELSYTHKKYNTQIHSEKISKDDKVKKSKIEFTSNEPLEESVKELYKTERIIELYKNGSTSEEIAHILDCSITEVNLVLDMQNNENI